MPANSSFRMTDAGYAGKTATKAPPWHWIVVWDVLFNNLSTGLFLVAAFSELALPAVFTSVATVAYPIALVLLLADLACLVLDLGDPWRFHHMLRLFKPNSPMSLGTWCLTAYSLPLTALVAINLLPGEWLAAEWPRTLAVILAIPPAFGSAVYKGVLFSTTAQPGWRDARWLGGYLVSSALALGAAEMLMLAVLVKQERAAALLSPAFGALLVLNLIPLTLLLVELRPSLVRLYILGLGVLVPLGLLLVGRSPGAAVFAAVILVICSLAARYEIVMAPHKG